MRALKIETICTSLLERTVDSDDKDDDKTEMLTRKSKLDLTEKESFDTILTAASTRPSVVVGLGVGLVRELRSQRAG